MPMDLTGMKGLVPPTGAGQRLQGSRERYDMTPQQFVGFGTRLFAIWLFITAVQTLVLGREVAAQGAEGALLACMIGGLYFVGAVLSWTFPMAIAHKLVPRTRFEDRLSLPGTQAAVVACVVVGLLVIAFKALGPLAWYAAMVTMWVSAGQPVTAMPGDTHVNGLVGGIQLLVGLFLIMKAHSLGEAIMPSSDAPARDQGDA